MLYYVVMDMNLTILPEFLASIDLLVVVCNLLVSYYCFIFIVFGFLYAI